MSAGPRIRVARTFSNIARESNTTSMVSSKGPAFLLLQTWAISTNAGHYTASYSIGNIS